MHQVNDLVLWTSVLLFSIGALACGDDSPKQHTPDYYENLCENNEIYYNGVCLSDRDDDSVHDAIDNCPDLPNEHQTDSDNDGKGDACDYVDDRLDGDVSSTVDGDTPADGDMDEDEESFIPDGDAEDIQPPDGDMDPDPETEQEDDITPISGSGTVEDPFVIPGDPLAPDFRDSRDTREASSDIFNSYPPNELDESGPEFVYQVTVAEKMHVHAFIAFPEPEGVDIDVHLLAGLNPIELLARGHYEIEALLEPGTYWLILDTYVDEGQEMSGPYDLTVELVRYADGTVDDPIVLNEFLDEPLVLPFSYEDARDTSDAVSDRFDSYPPNQLDESGPEYVYAFRVDQEIRFSARIDDPEPEGTDVDLHLLSALDPVTLIARDHTALSETLAPGVYYLVMDTFVSEGTEMRGPYHLRVTARAADTGDATYFNRYILDAVDWLYDNYGLLGYDDVALTHDIEYGSYGIIPRSGGARTMCVAAVMEVILTAMQLYEDDTGDVGVWDFLPIDSWKYLRASDIRAHIWVNHDLDSWGTADALRIFGMGENVPFEQLEPGAFININRTTGTGHAVVFLSYIDDQGNQFETYDAERVIGFTYFSAQGGYTEGYGGFDYRYAIFETPEYAANGYPEMPYLRDIHIIRSDNPHYLNTGMMFHPDNWVNTRTPQTRKQALPVSRFNPAYFTGWTVDDVRLSGDRPKRL